MYSHLWVPDNDNCLVKLEEHLKFICQEGKRVTLIIYVDKHFNPLNINILNLLFLLESYRSEVKKHLVKTMFYIEHRNIFDYIQSFLKLVKPEQPIEFFNY